MKHNDETEIDVEVRARTSLALLVFDGSREVWVPRSQILDYEGDEDDPSSIVIPEWLAIKKGLV